jgi:hypothetical protein
MVPGDWVNLFSPGIWQVYRVLPIGYEMRFSLSERRRKSRRVIVFARRLVNADWRRSFKTGSCEQSLVHPLSAADDRRLKRVLRDDPELAAAFECYAPRPQGLIVNLTMRVPQVARLKFFCDQTLLPQIGAGLSVDEILKLLEESDLASFIGQFPINATLQLGCRDHEVRKGEFIMRDCRVLSS